MDMEKSPELGRSPKSKWENSDDEKVLTLSIMWFLDITYAPKSAFSA